MKAKVTLSIVGAAAALGAGGAVATGATGAASGVSAAASRHVEGRVVTINRAAHTFKVRDLERGSLSVKVTRRTRFERIAGFAALRVSQRVDVRAVRSNGDWHAIRVQRSGRVVHRGVSVSGRGNDDPVGHDVGDDRGGQRGADDPAGHDAGDDRGGQRGADDPAGHDVGDDHGDHGGR